MRSLDASMDEDDADDDDDEEAPRQGGLLSGFCCG